MTRVIEVQVERLVRLQSAACEAIEMLRFSGEMAKCLISAGRREGRSPSADLQRLDLSGLAAKKLDDRMKEMGAGLGSIRNRRGGPR